jgi:hypothetical protein
MKLTELEEELLAACLAIRKAILESEMDTLFSRLEKCGPILNTAIAKAERWKHTW